MKSLRREIGLVLHSLRDLFVRILPNFSQTGTYKYAFLVHPRNDKDIYRKYPALKILPPKFMTNILRWYWPVRLSNVTGLKSQKDGKEVQGFIFAIPLTARQMLEDRGFALKKILQAVILAKKSGAKIIGLGGLTSSLSKGGLDIVSQIKGINVTTGHAYTAYNVTQTFLSIFKIFDLDKTKALVAIVGAAGSVGSTSAKIIAREGFTNLMLIDMERKKDQFPSLIDEIKRFDQNISISISHRIQDIEKADFIITATNAPEALIKNQDVKPGAVIVDDAQPSDVAPEVLTRKDVLVLEAGIVHTPDVFSHFNFNLKDKNDNFCCMAEVLILASINHDEHYVINRATLKHVDEISEAGKKLGFRVAEFQNFNESISQDKINRVRMIARKTWNLN